MQALKAICLKTLQPLEVIEAIETVHKGDTYYCSFSSKSLIKKIGTSIHNHFKISNSIHFSETERSIIKSICKQLTTKEIAREMRFSEKTIEQYSKKIKEKTGAKNLVGIALFAVKNKMIDLKEI